MGYNYTGKNIKQLKNPGKIYIVCLIQIISLKHQASITQYIQNINIKKNTL